MEGILFGTNAKIYYQHPNTWKYWQWCSFNTRFRMREYGDVLYWKRNDLDDVMTLKHFSHNQSLVKGNHRWKGWKWRASMLLLSAWISCWMCRHCSNLCISGTTMKSWSCVFASLLSNFWFHFPLHLLLPTTCQAIHSRDKKLTSLGKCRITHCFMSTIEKAILSL